MYLQHNWMTLARYILPARTFMNRSYGKQVQKQTRTIRETYDNDKANFLNRMFTFKMLFLSSPKLRHNTKIKKSNIQGTGIPES